MAKLPTTNISTTLVKTTLGETTDDVGKLCKSAKINKWSKWKPIPYNGLSLSDDILQRNDFGINITQDFLNKLHTVPTRTWEYMRPKGGANSMYRIGDFRNYVHDSLPPFQQFKYGFTMSFSIHGLYDAYRTVYLDIYKNVPEGSITVNDLRLPLSSIWIKNCYFGLCLFSESDTCVLIATSKDKIGTGEKRALLNVDMSKIDGVFWGGYFLSAWTLEQQLLYPKPSQIPSADIYFLEGNPGPITVSNALIKWSFPYTFWNTDDFYQGFGQTISFNTYTYTYKSTNTGTSVIPGGPMGTNTEYGHVRFDGNGAIILTPTREMEEFPSDVRTLLLTAVRNAFMNYTPQLSHMGKSYIGLFSYYDIDSEPTTIGIQYTYVENEAYGAWYARIFMGSITGTMLSPEFLAATVTFGSNDDYYEYYNINSIKIEVDYFSGTKVKMTVTAFIEGRSEISISATYGDIPNDSPIEIGWGHEMAVEGKDVYPGNMPAGIVEVNYYCPHA